MPFALPAEVGFHLDFLLALRYIVQLRDEHAVAVRENTNLNKERRRAACTRVSRGNRGIYTGESEL